MKPVYHICTYAHLDIQVLMRHLSDVRGKSVQAARGSTGGRRMMCTSMCTRIPVLYAMRSRSGHHCATLVLPRRPCRHTNQLPAELYATRTMLLRRRASGKLYLPPDVSPVGLVLGQKSERLQRFGCHSYLSVVLDSSPMRPRNFQQVTRCPLDEPSTITLPHIREPGRRLPGTSSLKWFMVGKLKVQLAISPIHVFANAPWPSPVRPPGRAGPGPL